MRSNRPGRESDQFTLRFPDGMRNKVKKAASRNRRSMNSELIFLIENGMQLAYAKKSSEDSLGVNKADEKQGGAA